MNKYYEKVYQPHSFKTSPWLLCLILAVGIFIGALSWSLIVIPDNDDDTLFQAVSGHVESDECHAFCKGGG